MAASLIKQLAEEERQLRTGDKNWFKKEPYVFVLRGPEFKGPLGSGGRATFPMPLNPESFEYSLPYAANITPLQEGGVVAEENGFVIGEIRIEATTGFKLRSPLDTFVSSGSGNFTGGLDSGVGSPYDELSGQMLMWRLASRLFEGYSDLKKDPESAPKTTMEFHSLKDDLHLLVVPRVFNITRNADRDRVSYRYNCQLAVVGRASAAVDLLPSPDVGLLQSFKNTIAKIRNTIQSIAATINDITAAIDDIRRTITGIAGIINDVASIVDSFTDFITGIKKFADIPSVFIDATANLLESAANFAGTVASFPADVAQSFLNIRDDLHRLKVSARDHFRDSMSEVSKKYERLSEGYRSGRDETRDVLVTQKAATAASSNGRMSVSSAFGDSVKPGDSTRGQIGSLLSRTRLKAGEYVGFQEKVISQGDTLQSLAARHLGDARKWIDIAIINQLKAPYITNVSGVPRTLSLGDKITIPTTATAKSPDTLTTGNPTTGSGQRDAQLGVDYNMSKFNDGTFAWQIDTAGGSTDVHKVSGIDNLGQAIEMRFRTEQGENILYPNIGIPRIIGQKGVREVIVNANYEAQGQLLAEPRIESISKFKLVQNDDVVEIETEVKPIGSSSNRVISRTLT